MLPPLPIRAPSPLPLSGGLYDAASIITETPPRHEGGVELHDPWHGTGHGLWPSICPTPEEHTKTADTISEPRVFTPVTVWTSVDCSTVGSTGIELEDRATQLLELRERLAVEQHVATQLAALDPDNPHPAADLVEAVIRAEHVLNQRAQQGIIHAHRALLPLFDKHGMIKRQATTMFTPGGHRWAFGAGYQPLGATLAATGTVIIHRGQATTSTTSDPRHNTRHGVAERIITPAFATPAATIPLTVSDTVKGLITP